MLIQRLRICIRTRKVKKVADLEAVHVTVERAHRIAQARAIRTTVRVSELEHL